MCRHDCAIPATPPWHSPCAEAIFAFTAGVGLLVREVGEQVAGLEAVATSLLVDQREEEQRLDVRVARGDLLRLT